MGLQLNEIPLHYIVGVGRSGTTFLVSAFNKNKNVVANPESLFQLHLYSLIKNKTVFSVSEIDALLNEIYSIKQGRFVNLDVWFLNKEKLRNDLILQKNNLPFLNWVKTVHLHSELALSKNEINIIVDKNPTYTLHIEKLIRLNPKSKVIALVRDFRDNSVSRHEFKMDSKLNYIYHGLIWNHYNKCILNAKKKFPDRIKIIKYEDLVGNYDSTISEINNFLEINNHEIDTKAGENYQSKLGEFLDEEQKKWFVKMHEHVTQPADSSKIGSWKNVLSKKDLLLLEATCKTVAKNFNYSLETNAQLAVSLYPKYALYWLFLKYEIAIHHFYYSSPLSIRKFGAKLKSIFKKKS